METSKQKYPSKQAEKNTKNFIDYYYYYCYYQKFIADLLLQHKQPKFGFR